MYACKKELDETIFFCLPVSEIHNISKLITAKLIWNRLRHEHRLTERFPRVELGMTVSWNISLLFGSQRVQLMLDNILTLSHTEEAVSIPWRDGTETQCHSPQRHVFTGCYSDATYFRQSMWAVMRLRGSDQIDLCWRRIKWCIKFSLFMQFCTELT